MKPFIRYSPEAGAYVWMWKLLKLAMRDHGPACEVRRDWFGWPSMVGKMYKDVLEALDRRINARGGVPPTGRKFSQEYQINLRRDYYDVQNKVQRRVRLYQLRTPELRRRFAYLLDDRNEV